VKSNDSIERNKAAVLSAVGKGLEALQGGALFFAVLLAISTGTGASRQHIIGTLVMWKRREEYGKYTETGED